MRDGNGGGSGEAITDELTTLFSKVLKPTIIMVNNDDLELT